MGGRTVYRDLVSLCWFSRDCKCPDLWEARRCRFSRRHRRSLEGLGGSQYSVGMHFSVTVLWWSVENGFKAINIDLST